MLDVSIRKAVNSDLGPIVSLYNLLWTDSDQPLDMKVAANIFGRVQGQPNSSFYVAEHEGRIVGTFVLFIVDNLSHGGAPEGLIENVVVHRKYQRQGVGRQMMSFAMKRCKEEGCYKIVLSSSDKRDNAHEFYESLGFERHGYSFVVNLEDGGKDQREEHR